MTRSPYVVPAVLQGYKPDWLAYPNDDLHQDGAVAVLEAEKKYPGNRRHAQLRARQKIARESVKNYKRLQKQRPLEEANGRIWNDEHVYNVILLREVLDLLPYSLREETLLALLTCNGKQIGRIGREIKRTLPKKEVEP